MATNNFNNFNQKVKDLFQPALEKYGYALADVKIYEIKEVIWSIRFIFINSEAELRIEIEEAPRYSDYGFSFFIYKLGTKEYNILYNVPHERQDKDDNYLNMAYEDLFSNSRDT
jgi:hypothetical protein